MNSELHNALMVSASGMRVQGARVRVITENVANSATTGTTPGADPYTKQQITFANELDREMGVKLVRVESIEPDNAKPFPLEYLPDHPAANEEGYVKMPNVNSLIETMDIREAQRTYEANLGMIEQTKSMLMRTIDLLRPA